MQQNIRLTESVADLRERYVKLRNALEDIVDFSTPVPGTESNYVPRREVKAAATLLAILAKEDK